MDNDTRIPLPTNEEFRLSILDEKGTPHDFTIKDEIARGGSCIVYSGVWNDTIGTEPPTPRDVIIKEFYPRSPKEPINRDNDSHELLIGGIPADKNRKFLLERDRFNRGQRMCAAYASKHPNFVLSQLVSSGSANNTSYAVLLRGEGTVLSKLDRSTINLTDAIEIAESLCDAIGSIHDYKSYVYLDCKPDNISVSGNRVKLFDFDTMQPVDRIIVPSFSKGYSAPEQIEKDESGFIDTRNIGVHSDIFAIGATFFWLLTGKNPYEAGLKNIQSETSWVEAIDLKDTTDALHDEGFKGELVRIMRSVLETDPKIRQQAFGFNKPAIKLKNDFSHLREIAKSAPDRREFEKTNENIDAGVRTIIDHIDALKESVSDGLSAKDNGDDSSKQKTIDVSKGGKKDDQSLGNVVIACVLLSVIIGCILFVLDLYGRNNNQADRSSEQATGSIQEDESDGELAWVYPGLSKAPLSQEEADIEVTFEPWDSTFGSTYIGETDASIGQSITVSGGTGTDTGMYLYDEKGNLLAQGRNGLFSNIVYFKINEELNYTLEPGTTYKYKFFAVVNGKTYWSSEQSFTTTKNDKTLDAEEQQTITIYFDANGGLCSITSLKIPYCTTLGQLPIPSKLNYTFEGWYLDYGARVTENTMFFSGGDQTVYAHWKSAIENEATIGWVKASEVPMGVRIVEKKYSYTQRTYKESQNISEEGYIRCSDFWVVSSKGSRTYAEFPTGFNINNWYYQNWNDEPYAVDGVDGLDDTFKREVSNNWAGYIYWHWMYDVPYENTTSRVISSKYGVFEPYNFLWDAFYVMTSNVNCPYLDNKYQEGGQALPCYDCSSILPEGAEINDGIGTPRFFRFDYYVSTYTEYIRMFKYYKDENKESTSYPSGNDISNIVEWVKYRTE